MSHFGALEELMKYLYNTTRHKSIFIGSLLPHPELREWDIVECSSKQAFVFHFFIHLCMKHESEPASSSYTMKWNLHLWLLVLWSHLQYMLVYSKKMIKITFSRYSHLKFPYLLGKINIKRLMTHLALPYVHRFLSNQMLWGQLSP